MRQRKVKNEAARLEALDHLQIKNSKDLPGKWREFIGIVDSLNPKAEAEIGAEVGLGVSPPGFEKSSDFNGKIYMELGCGRGHFINALAREKPGDFFIGVEGRSSVVLRAMELTEENQLTNLIFIPDFILKMEEHFAQEELDGIYLNFSDPWPKKRHEKRRLTHKDYLIGYKKALKSGGFIEIKTDSQGLFDFTLGQCEMAGFRITDQSRDLHKSSLAAKEITTQYERRFMLLDKPIYYLRLEV